MDETIQIFGKHAFVLSPLWTLLVEYRNNVAKPGLFYVEYQSILIY